MRIDFGDCEPSENRHYLTMDQNVNLGTIFLPRSGVGVGKFSFIINRDRPGKKTKAQVSGLDVKVGVPVVAETDEGVIVGVVVDMKTVGTDDDPVFVEAARSQNSIGAMREVMIADCQVFGDVAARPVGAGFVRPASAEEVKIATGYNKTPWPIAAGCVELIGGGLAPVFYDGGALLGPESAHMIVGGLSGQASKTSYVGTVMRAALDAGDPTERRVAALIVNVKGQDMLWLDRPPTSGFELQEKDIELYKAMGVEPKPFSNVTVWSPAEPGGDGPRSPRQDARIIKWGLKTVWYNLYQLSPYLMEDEKTAGFIAQFGESMLRTINTFDKLDAWFEQEIERIEDDGNKSNVGWGGTHVATLRKLRRSFKNLRARGKGLFSKGEASPENDIPTVGWEHGDVLVLDLAGLPHDVQGFALSRVCQQLLNSAEGGELGVDHLIVFADELNTFAPSGGGDMAQVRKALGLISKQGRYAGVSLWGAAQKLSKVDEMVRDNAATRALGITVDAELSSGIYGKIPSGLAERIATLPKGQMALWHHLFRQALLVTFPRPAWQTGRSKTSGDTKAGKRALDHVGNRHNLSEKSLQRATEGLDEDQVNAILVDADDPAAALEELLAVREVDTATVRVTAAREDSPEDPYEIL